PTNVLTPFWSRGTPWSATQTGSAKPWTLTTHSTAMNACRLRLPTPTWLHRLLPKPGHDFLTACSNLHAATNNLTTLPSSSSKGCHCDSHGPSLSSPATLRTQPAVSIACARPGQPGTRSCHATSQTRRQPL